MQKRERKTERERETERAFESRCLLVVLGGVPRLGKMPNLGYTIGVVNTGRHVILIFFVLIKNRI